LLTRRWGPARSLVRAAKLCARGDLDKARRLFAAARIELFVRPGPEMPALAEVLAHLAPSPRQPEPLAERVDVVVPVHDGLAHVRRLFATLFERTDAKHRILLADDASADAEVVALLRAAARAHANVRLLRNDANAGFVATVNRAMRETRGHVALLNTDTEVPPGWLERLMRPVLAEPKVASATPFSNAAAIFSFPVPDQDNPLPADVSLLELDRAFARLSPAADPSLDAPTGIGFCMSVNRAAWDAAGPFDEAAFGRGYGEETDWCRRCAAAGWRNVLAPDLFVFHLHGGTFANADRKALIHANLRLLRRRWPSYHRELASFRRRDPWATRRSAAILALATAPEARPLVIADPGAIRAGEDPRAEQATADRRGVIRIRTAADGSFTVEARRGGLRAVMRAGDAAELARLTASGIDGESL
jgi:O-antigen biosynthesis protein